MPPRVLMPLAPGFEELEAVAPVDFLRRAGAVVTLAGVEGLAVTGRNALTVQADLLLADVLNERYDAIVLPGGPGTKRLLEHSGLHALLRRHAAEGRLLAAICAAPTVLAALGLLEGRPAACYPGCESQMAGAELRQDAIVREGNLLTSRGAGTSLAFGLALVEALFGSQKAKEIAASVVYG